MRIRLGSALASALTFGVGLITVLGLLVGEDLGLLSDFVAAAELREITIFLLEIVTIVIALTVLIGILNLILVHLRRMNRIRRGGLYSMVLIASFALVVVLYVLQREDSFVLLETVQLSVESALAGLVLFALVYGAYRIMRYRVTWSGGLFVVALLVVLIGALPFSELQVFHDLRDWLVRVPVSAGTRGLLLGIALATIVTGVRVLIGIDRSYRE